MALGGRNECVLILEDSVAMRTEIDNNLKIFGYQTKSAETILEAMPFIRRREVDIAIVDYILDRENGFDFLNEVHEFRKYFPMIMLTAYSSTHIATEWMKAGGSDFAEKPVIDYKLLDLQIRCAIAVSKYRRTLELMKQEDISERITYSFSSVLKGEIEFIAKHANDPVAVRNSIDKIKQELNI